jgi:SAM-dependent methyltransferase
MMGVTTYVTTDLAAMPLLWVGPLALYLLSFIIVFSKVPRMVHQGMILAMPLLVLLLVFLMQSEVKPDVVAYNIGLHLAALFVVAMVCHGELAQDRPATRYLTEFYLLMSVGGVLGGLFNALLAPQVFNSLVEYSLAMVAACLLLPPLTDDKPGAWALTVDRVLAGAFVLAGLVLMVFRIFEQSLRVDLLFRDGSWIPPLLGLLFIVGAGLFGIWRARREDRAFAVMDLVLPLSLVVLIIGLFWGLTADLLLVQVEHLGALWNIKPQRLLLILTYGLPTVLCYTFVERSVRFGLGVAALLLGSAFVSIFFSETVLQKRSFFGVLSVKYDADFMRLMHGTTQHGTQHCPGPKHDAERTRILRDYFGRIPLSYYHYSGPIGHVFEAYNPDHPALGLLAGPLAGCSAVPGRTPRVGVIGLGTGTLAAYGRPGQHFTFYDIDPLVRDIAYNPKYFTYVRDAQNRGVKLGEPILNDARLAIERQLAERPDWPEDEKYGLLMVDAFSSDAIPVHLITREALQDYLKVVRQDGLIAFHISNRYLDLRPVLANLAREEKLVGYYENDEDESRQIHGITTSIWVVLARSEKVLERLMTTERQKRDRAEIRRDPQLLLALPAEAQSILESRRQGARAALQALMAWPEAGPGVSSTAGLCYSLFLSAEEELNRQDSESKPSFAPWMRLEPLDKVGVWTDDYSNLLSVFGNPYKAK